MMTQYIRKDSYEAVHLDDEWIILNTDNYTVTKLNEIGGFCWSLLHNVQTVSSLIQAIREEYQSVDETVEKDIPSFLSDLMKYGLVEYAS